MASTNSSELPNAEPTVTAPARRAAPFLPYVDSVRALAALYVLVFHAVFTPASNSVVYASALKYPIYLFSFGRYAVAFFIVISGFCLMLPAHAAGNTLRDGIGPFLTRRARRIIPPYYAALLLCTIAGATIFSIKTGSFWDNAVPFGVNDIALHVLLLHDLFLATKHTINTVLWSISVEFRIYLLFPLMLLLWRKAGPIALVGSLVVGGYTLIALLSSPTLAPLKLAVGPNIDSGIMPHYGALFALGMCAAAYVSRQGGKPVSRGWEIASCALFILLALLTWASPIPRTVLDLLAGIWAICALIALSDSRALLQRFVDNPITRFIGPFSYSVYLVHGLVLQAIWQLILMPRHLSPTTSLLILVTIGSIATIAASYAFYLAFERPFVRRRAT